MGRPQAQADRKRNLADHVIPRLGGVALADLNAAHFNRLYADLLRDGRVHQPGGLSPTSVRRIHAMIRKALNEAVRWGLLTSNVALLADPPPMRVVKASRRRGMQTWSPSELRDFLDSTREHELHVLSETPSRIWARSYLIVRPDQSEEARATASTFTCWATYFTAASGLLTNVAREPAFELEALQQQGEPEPGRPGLVAYEGRVAIHEGPNRYPLGSLLCPWGHAREFQADPGAPAPDAPTMGAPPSPVGANGGTVPS